MSPDIELALVIRGFDEQGGTVHVLQFAGNVRPQPALRLRTYICNKMLGSMFVKISIPQQQQRRQEVRHLYRSPTAVLTPKEI